MELILNAAKEVCDFMRARRWKFCLIGGLVVERWGKPRLTQDVDITLLTGFGNEESYVNILLEHFPARYDDAQDFALVNRVLLIYTGNGTPVDISLGALPYEEEVVKHSTPFAFSDGITLPTCSADDLFVLKIFAARPKDLMDAEGIVVRQGGKLRRRYILSRLTMLCDATDRPELVVMAEKILEGKPWHK